MAGIRLIVGLGNPGADYAKTRHNAGAWFVQQLSEKHHKPLCKENKFWGYIASIPFPTHPLWLFTPTTFMNDSGRAVAAVAQFYKITPQEILVAHDELDFIAGDIRLKENGGHGGHNGLRDIIQHLSSADFYRLRIGIGHPGHKDHVTPYVLSDPSHHEMELMLQAMTQAMVLLPDFIAGNFQKIMQQLHE
ncbi:MAG: aminoacyl-tRNA hydrolase [Coxiella sp. RIFCSPHIGHO2_12_FULL_44_14]|nr:MAG: aminoacyl-tRNA hydrolase [Coxiella sp. RIFCSPHIGHO2_12_FULL_44_14]